MGGALSSFEARPAPPPPRAAVYVPAPRVGTNVHSADLRQLRPANRTRAHSIAAPPPAAVPTAAIVQLHSRDEDGHMVPRARTARSAAVTWHWLARVAATSVDDATRRGFMTLWDDGVRSSPCTRRLGSGKNGSVFRVCRSSSGAAARSSRSSTEASCVSCVAVKFGAAMTRDGRAEINVEVQDTRGRRLRDEVRLMTLTDAPIRAIDGLSIEELEVTQLVTERALDTGATPHAPRFLGAMDARGGPLRFLFLEYILPAQVEPRISTLKELIQHVPTWEGMPELEWRSLLFQVLYTIAALQAKIAGFRHNDVNWGNIALSSGAGHASTTYTVTPLTARVQGAMSSAARSHPPGTFGSLGAWRVTAPRFWPYLIDYGMARTAAIDNANRDPRGLREAECTPNVYFDAHFLLAMLLEVTPLARRRDVDAFFAFVYDCIPREYFEDGRLTEKLRLTPRGLRAIEWDSRAVPPVVMLTHAYFAPLRVTPPAASAAGGSGAAYRFNA